MSYPGPDNRPRRGALFENCQVDRTESAVFMHALDRTAKMRLEGVDAVDYATQCVERFRQRNS